MGNDSVGLEDVVLPYGSLPAIWIGSPRIGVVEGTRWFTETGSMAEFRPWLDELHKANPGDLIPMQWAPQYVGVTRPGIRKRAISGNLTVFSFTVEETFKSLLGRRKDRESRTSFDYLVLSECKAWRDELILRSDARRLARRIEDDERAAGIPPAHREKGKGKK